MRACAHWKRGLAWLALLGPSFFLSYGFANHVAALRAQVPEVVFGWERHIPFVPWTIVPYWSIDAFYALSLLVARSRPELDRHARRLLTAQLLCVACFLLVPLRFATPHPHVEGWARGWFDALGRFDLPYNQAPSLHIALLLVLWDFWRRRSHGIAKAACDAWSALIAVSVLTTWQHHVIDVPTGLLAGALCLWLWPIEGERPSWRWTPSRSRRRIALAYGAGAVALALVAGSARVAWWLSWPAASLALVALCYAALGAQGFQQRIDGRHSLASRWLFAPYRLGAWINARWWTRRMPASVAVTSRVWLGRLPLPWDVDHARFERIVDLAGELSLRHRGARAHAWLDLVEPSPEELLEAARSVQQGAAQGRVLVACALGLSRSAAVVATWLCLHGGCASVDEALRHLRRSRPQVVLEEPMLRAIRQAVAAGRGLTRALPSRAPCERLRRLPCARGTPPGCPGR